MENYHVSFSDFVFFQILKSVTHCEHKTILDLQDVTGICLY